VASSTASRFGYKKVLRNGVSLDGHVSNRRSSTTALVFSHATPHNTHPWLILVCIIDRGSFSSLARARIVSPRASPSFKLY
jgi:hypothetical protein